MNTEPATQAPAPDALHEFLQHTFLGNDMRHWSYLLIAILVAYAVGKIAGIFFNLAGNRMAKKERATMASLMHGTAKTMGFFSIVLGLYIGLNFIQMHPAAGNIIHTAVSMLFVVVGGIYAWRVAQAVTDGFEAYADRTPGKMDDMLVPIIKNGLRALVIALFVVEMVQVFSHEQVTSILAGLGIGGLAVALAAQDSIKNVFGSLVIIADKPFMIDERIVVDNVDGIVEEVGVRSTRIRTMTGNVVTIPNGELANKTIENIGQRRTITRAMDITLTYDMSPEKVARAKQVVAEILAVGPKQGGRTEDGNVANPDLPPRIYFKEFANSSMNISVQYWYDSAKYWDYMAYNDWFNFELLKRFNAEGIDMAFPTQTLYLAGDAKRPLNIGNLNQQTGPKA
jgi:MscS family membrane protein